MAHVAEEISRLRVASLGRGGAGVVALPAGADGAMLLMELDLQLEIDDHRC